MRYLLDTCALLWWAKGQSSLSERATDIINDAGNQGYVAAISLFEISMKVVTGKLAWPLTPSQLCAFVESQGLTVLPMAVNHVEMFNSLSTTHRDPFDRLLAATALHEELSLITPDIAFDSLGVSRIW